MTPARRSALPAVLLAAALWLGACGSAAPPTGVATGPSQSPGPPTTAGPTASATAGPTPQATAAATPTPTPAATPPSGGGIIPSGDPDGATKLGQYLYPSNTGLACGARTGHYDSCPLTSRMASRLDSHPTYPAEPMCRCENVWQQSSVSSTQTPDPTVWIVHVVLTFGPHATVDIDLRALRTGSGWLGDDTTCTGQGESSSIYAQNPPPCPGT